MNEIQERLKKVYKINIEDSERIIDLLTGSTDPEELKYLQRAKDDLQMYTEKLKRLEEGDQ